MCHVCDVLLTPLVCWFYTSALGLILLLWGRLGISDDYFLSGISRLSIHSTRLFPFSFFCRVLSLFLSPDIISRDWLGSKRQLTDCYCICLLLTFFQKILQYFSLRDRLFLYDSCLAAGRSKLVGGCEACCLMALVFAVMNLYDI